MSPRAQGILYAELNALLGGAMFVVGHQVTDAMSPLRFTALMYLVIAPLNTLWWWLTHNGVLKPLHATPVIASHNRSAEIANAHPPNSPLALFWAALHTLSSVGGITLLWLGMAQVDSAVGSLLSRLEVLVAILIGLWLLRERFAAVQWLGFILTLGGLLLIRWTVLAGEPAGFIYLVLGSVFFGMAEASGKVAVRYMPVPRLMLLRAWVMAACLVAIWWIVAPGWPAVPLSVWGWLVLSALLGPLLSRNCYMLSLSYLPVSQVVLLNQTQPVFAAIFGYLLRSEIPAAMFYVGGATLVAGNVLLILSKRDTKQKLPAQP